MDAKAFVSDLIEKSRKAQVIFEKYDQAKVDEAVRAAGKAIYDRGEELARMAVDESKMGCYEDKILKNKGKAMAVWNHLKGKKSVGIIERDEANGMVKIAKPMGVIGAIAPVTNPVMTPMHNVMIALKGRNSVIVCPHPAGKKTGVETIKTINAALAKIGAPENLVQVTPEPTLEISNLVMQMADVCIATGGPGMVKAAYSAGKPAYGVGPGNMQCMIDRDANIEDLVPKVIRGRIYDNGVLCTCEQCIVYPKEMEEKLFAEFAKKGGYYVSDAKDAKSVRDTMFPDGALNKTAVGLSAPKLADMSGFTVPEDTKLLLVKAEGAGAKEILSKEKLFPIVTAYPYDTWDEAIAIVQANLEFEGKGHSTVIHSFNKENIEKAAIAIPVSRFLVNGVGSSGVGGAYSNSFVPTATLGCGSWGINSLSENLDYIHLINISRLGYTDESRPTFTPEAVWG